MSDLAFFYAPIGLAELEHRTIKRCNSQFAAMFGDEPKSFSGQPMANLYPSQRDYERIGARGLKIMRKTGRYADERIMRRRDGSLFWCRVRGQSLTPENPFGHGV